MANLTNHQLTVRWTENGKLYHKDQIVLLDMMAPSYQMSLQNMLEMFSSTVRPDAGTHVETKFQKLQTARSNIALFTTEPVLDSRYQTYSESEIDTAVIEFAVMWGNEIGCRENEDEEFMTQLDVYALDKLISETKLREKLTSWAIDWQRGNISDKREFFRRRMAEVYEIDLRDFRLGQPIPEAEYKKIYDAAVTEAEQIRSDALSQARQIRQEAEDAAEKIRDEARSLKEKAARLMSEALDERNRNALEKAKSLNEITAVQAAVEQERLKLSALRQELDKLSIARSAIDRAAAGRASAQTAATAPAPAQAPAPEPIRIPTPQASHEPTEPVRTASVREPDMPATEPVPGTATESPQEPPDGLPAQKGTGIPPEPETRPEDSQKPPEGCPVQEPEENPEAQAPGREPGADEDSDGTAATAGEPETGAYGTPDGGGAPDNGPTPEGNENPDEADIPATEPKTGTTGDPEETDAPAVTPEPGADEDPDGTDVPAIGPATGEDGTEPDPAEQEAPEESLPDPVEPDPQETTVTTPNGQPAEDHGNRQDDGAGDHRPEDAEESEGQQRSGAAEEQQPGASDEQRTGTAKGIENEQQAGTAEEQRTGDAEGTEDEQRAGTAGEQQTGDADDPPPDETDGQPQENAGGPDSEDIPGPEDEPDPGPENNPEPDPENIPDPDRESAPGPDDSNLIGAIEASAASDAAAAAEYAANAPAPEDGGKPDPAPAGVPDERLFINDDDSVYSNPSADDEKIIAYGKPARIEMKIPEAWQNAGPVTLMKYLRQIHPVHLLKVMQRSEMIATVQWSQNRADPNKKEIPWNLFSLYEFVCGGWAVDMSPRQQSKMIVQFLNTYANKDIEVKDPDSYRTYNVFQYIAKVLADGETLN